MSGTPQDDGTDEHRGDENEVVKEKREENPHNPQTHTVQLC